MNPYMPSVGETMHAVIPRVGVVWRRRRQQTGRVRAGAVSSFGMSGTNAHAIIVEAPVIDEEAGKTPDTTGATTTSAGGEQVMMLWISAKSEGALRELVRLYTVRMEQAQNEVTQHRLQRHDHTERGCWERAT